MSSCLEILNTKEAETNKIKTTRHFAHSSAFGGGIKYANRRQKRLRKHSGNPSVEISASKIITTTHKSPGLLQKLTSKLRGAENSVHYVALNQTDLEKGLPSVSDGKSLQDDSNNSGTQNTSSSSSEEDLFVSNSRQKQRRKMTRKGTYSMRETYENSRQYYPATLHHIHQHFNNNQQQEHQHEKAVVVQQQHCNLHKGVEGKQQQYFQHQQHQPQIRLELPTQSPQLQQQHNQYQNIGTWLPQNKNIPVTTTTTQMNGKIDDIKHHRNHEQYQQDQRQEQQQQLPQKTIQHHLHQHQHQHQQPSNYCAQRLDTNTANGRNSCLIESIESDFIVGKTFITPPDIPSPPPQPIVSDNKRFQRNLATTTATNTLINKNCCQCEGRLKNLQNLNHTPVAQHHNSNHCHIHQSQQQQQQQQQQYQHHTTTTTTTPIHHNNSLPHQYHTHSHQHQQQQQQQINNEESLILPKASSALKSQHYHNQQQQQQQQQQQYNQHSLSQQHYRKVDVFAAASLDDDDNDTSPSIKLNGGLLVRNCKHLQNKQMQEQYKQHLERNGWSRKTCSMKEDYEPYKHNNDDNLYRDLSLESYQSFYEPERNSWPNQQHQQQQQQQHKQQLPQQEQISFNSNNNIQQFYGGGNDGLGNQSEDRRVNGLNGQHAAAYQHIIYNNDDQETNFKPAVDIENSEEEVSHDSMNRTTLASKTHTNFLLPLDIPTPPMPLCHNLTKRLLSSHNQLQNACQCDKQMNFMPHNTMSNNLKNQVNHISFIQTTTAQQAQAGPNQNNQATTTPSNTKVKNLTLMHNRGSNSCSSSLSGGSIGCSGLNLNESDQHLTHSQEPLQHHHLCQQKNFKLQHIKHSQHQHYIQQLPHTTAASQCQQQQQQQQQQYKQLPSYESYAASLQYLPQLPQLLSINNSSSNNNSLALSHRRMAPTFNHIADKNYMKNLVYSPQKLRHIRIILCVVGGIVLLALLGTALYFIVSSSENASKDSISSGRTNGIHLEDILQGKLSAHPFNGSWSTGSNIIYKENNAIMEYNVLTKQKTRLLLDTNQQYILYEKSADGTLLLLAKNYKRNFRHSFVAEYDIYDIESGVIKPLEIQKQSKPLIMVQWAPVGNALIINYERNLYYKPTAFADEIALTDDTNAAILNGIPDWVYEEEVFASNSAVWFSPDGKKLAFIQFDDSPTNVINFPVYGEAGDLRFQYPYNRLVAYPKAGSPNPRVKLFTSDLERAAMGTDHLTNIPVPSALNTEGDYIITVVDWLNNTNVLSVWMNRIQNQAHVQIFNGLRRQKAISLESKTGWVDFFSAPFKNRDGTRIAFIMPQPQDISGDYRHLVVLSTASSSGKPEALTKGKYVVTSILHWDTTHDIIFYTANTEDKPEQLHVYAIRAATGQTAKCLTCNLQKSNGIKQTYYSAVFNTKNQVIITSLGPNLPQSVIYEWSYANNQVSLNKLVTWEDNEKLKRKVEKLAMPTVEIETIPIADNFKAKVLLQFPPNMDRSGKTKYPLLVDVYGGPDSYSVVDKWIVDWGTYLSSNQSVIYAKIDGRGSGLRGEKLLHSVYLKLGTVEIADQIDVTKQLQKKYNFIDANHTGIWGWSYGGYAAAMALANDKEHIFRCAASIAPVTDWAYYDSIYTERYMGLPSINELGYAASRLSTKATQLRGKKFLLVHGTLDDNVHYQQAMILAKNLERHDILFKQISYPDEDHALAGVRPHLYHSLDKFFGDCFAKSRMNHSQ